MTNNTQDKVIDMALCRSICVVKQLSLGVISAKPYSGLIIQRLEKNVTKESLPLEPPIRHIALQSMETDSSYYGLPTCFSPIYAISELQVKSEASGILLPI